MTLYVGVSFQSDKKREYKRMGKPLRVYGIRSFVYRIPQPHAAYAYRVYYGILALHVRSCVRCVCVFVCLCVCLFVCVRACPNREPYHNPTFHHDPLHK